MRLGHSPRATEVEATFDGQSPVWAFRLAIGQSLNMQSRCGEIFRMPVGALVEGDGKW